MERRGVTAVDRAFSIIESFHAGEESLSLQTLAGRTGLNKATIIRLIASLEKTGCMSRLAHGAYALGPALLRYGSLYQSSFHLSDHLLPILRDLVRQSGETAAFFVRDGDMRICLHRIESNSALRLHLKEGERHPLLPGGTGKVLIAFSNEGGEALELDPRELLHPQHRRARAGDLLRRRAGAAGGRRAGGRGVAHRPDG